MNKISKKIVSLVTMAAFALTLVPMAAFAADPVTIDENVTAKTVNVIFNEDDTNVKIDVTKDGQPVTLTLNDKDGNDNQNLNTGDTIASVIGGVTDFQIKNLVAGSTYAITVKADSTQLASKTVYIPETTSVTASRLLADVDGSYVAGSITVDPQTKTTIQFNVRDLVNGTVNDEAINNATSNAQYVLVWAENSAGQFTDAITFTDGNVHLNQNGAYSATICADNNSDAVAVVNGNTITATFNRPGTYSIHAAVISDAPQSNAKNIDEAYPDGEKLIGELQPINVTVNAQSAKTIDFTLSANGTTLGTHSTDFTWEINDGVTPNGQKVYTVSGTAYSAANQVAANEKLNLSVGNQSGIQLLDTQVGTDENGKFSFRFTLTKTGSFDISIQEAEGDVTAELTVVQGSVAPMDIETVADGGILLAGNDINYRNSVDFNSDNFFAGAVQFNVIDVYGHNAYGDDAIATEAVAGTATSTGNHDDHIAIVAKGEGSTLSDGDLNLVWSEDYGVYTLAYTGTKAEAMKDLVPGEYTVEISLNNGREATASFTLAQFGEVQELTLDMNARANGSSTSSQNNAITAIDDQVALGQVVKVIPYYVDEQGLKVPADPSDIVWGFNGDAVADRNLSIPTFTTAANNASNESLLGTQILVTALDKNTSKSVVKELTVVKAYLAETLAFDPVQGSVDEANTVDVSVMNGDAVSKVNGTLYASITDQSNADATVDLTVNDKVKNGKGSLVLESDAEGTVDVAVVVAADNGETYSGTLTYTFGNEDPYAGTTVFMTIGSQEYIVNNEVVDGSANNLGAPYVDSAYRTMVPIRALAESFGATVDFADNVVTIVDGDTTVVMNIGEATYTVNDAEATMDTVPVIGDGDRTYVPVRFVAEALGYDVNPMYNGAGLTSAVYFSK